MPWMGKYRERIRALTKTHRLQTDRGSISRGTAEVNTFCRCRIESEIFLLCLYPTLVLRMEQRLGSESAGARVHGGAWHGQRGAADALPGQHAASLLVVVIASHRLPSGQHAASWPAPVVYPGRLVSEALYPSIQRRSWLPAAATVLPGSDLGRVSDGWVLDDHRLLHQNRLFGTSYITSARCREQRGGLG